MASELHPLSTASALSPVSRLWRRPGASAPPIAVWLPAVLIAISMLLPLVYLVVRSTGASGEAWGLLVRPRTAQILWRSAVLVVAVTTLSVAVAVPLAWLTVRTDLPLRRLWGILTALPLVIPSYVGAFLVVSALGPKGLLQGLLAPLGVERLPDIYGFPGATLTLVLLSYPYILLTVRGALVRLDPALEESARSLGVGPWGSVWRVTLPQLRPAVAAGALLVGLYALSDFGAVSLLGYESFTWAIYQQFRSLELSSAAVHSLLLVALAVLILTMEVRFRGRMGYHGTGAGTARPQRVVRLGHWRWPALLFCAVVVAAALVLPISVLVYWLVRGVSAGEPLDLLWAATRNSAYVSALAALVAAVCSIPVAAMVVRYPSVLSRGVERLSVTGFALPGIVVAVSLVFFGANLAGPIYQTIWLLLLAYLVLHFPAALGATRAVLLQVSPRLEDAARGLGWTPLQTMLAVTAPLVRSGVLAGAVLVFLLTMKELPATLVLAPPQFQTLATAVWSASEEALFARAAAPALTLILISSVPMAFLVLRDGRGKP